MKRNRITKPCKSCGILFELVPCEAKVRSTCSRECSRKYFSELRKKIPHTWHHKIAASRRGKKNKKQYSMQYRMRMSELFRGEKSYRWKGGITEENNRIRTSMEYRVWREDVFKRDDYTCQECGERGGRLNADHIKPFAFFPELRLEISNGRTLCEECHRKTPTYGRPALAKI
jgi:hypothetical protein